MLTIKNLKVAYQNNIILDNFDLTIKTNTIHGIVGLNGAGKTTLLNTIFGVKKALNGEIKFNDTKLTKKNISYLETVNYFYPRITGKEYLELFRINNLEFDIEKWNQIFELPLGKLVETYSTGMKKKLAFMGVISLNKPVIILDEPFNGVDLESNQKIKQILKSLCEKQKTIIITSHILEAMTNISDQISYMNNRQIEFTINKDEYSKLEEKIFSLHDTKSKELISGLLSDF